MTDPSTVTGLLMQLQRGDRQALTQLFPLVYEQLQAAAHVQRRRAGSDTLNTTALVHEAFIKLVRSRSISFHDRAHFMAVAATAMRHILIGYARRKAAFKRGGGRAVLPSSEFGDPFHDGAGLDETRAASLVALDRALARLEKHSPRQSRVVECRFFGGMSIEDTAEAIGISVATVKREWAVARAWLYREIQEDLR